VSFNLPSSAVTGLFLSHWALLELCSDLSGLAYGDGDLYLDLSWVMAAFKSIICSLIISMSFFLFFGGVLYLLSEICAAEVGNCVS
jgi:hypothetical protein